MVIFHSYVSLPEGKVNLDGLKMNGRQRLDDSMMCRLIDLIASSCLQLAQIPQCRQSEVVGSSPMAN